MRISPLSSVVVCYVFAVAALVAQPSVTLRTATAIVAETTVTLNLVRNSLPANTSITAPTGVNSTQTGGAATAAIVPRGAAGMEYTASASATGVFPLASSATANGVVEYFLAGQDRGWLIVEISGQAGSFANVDVRARVSGPGVVEGLIMNAGMAPIRRRVVRHVSFTSGFRLACEMHVNAHSVQPRTTTAEAAISIDFVPALPPISQTPYGVPCGLALSVLDATTLSQHAVTLGISGAFPGEPALYLFGGRRTSFPIGGCTLLVEPIAAVATVADAGGVSSLAFSFPGPLQSAPFVLQALAYDSALQVRTGPGFELRFVD